MNLVAKDVLLSALLCLQALIGGMGGVDSLGVWWVWITAGSQLNGSTWLAHVLYTLSQSQHSNCQRSAEYCV